MIHGVVVSRLDDTRSAQMTQRLEPGTTITVGRSRACDLRLNDVQVSARHAELKLVGRTITIRDLGSRNGTWLLDKDGEHRIADGKRETLDLLGALRIGPYRIVPCEALGDEVLLSSSHAFDISTQPEIALQRPPRHLADQAAARAYEALSRALSNTKEPLPKALLTELVRLAGADTGFLLELPGERLLAHEGIRGPAVLSQRFIEATVDRGGVWTFRPRSDENQEVCSESIRAYEPGIVLTGVCFEAGPHGVAAMGYLESRLAPPPEQEGALRCFAGIAGHFLEVHLRLDREVRRRQAIEESHREPSEVIFAHDDASREPTIITENPAMIAIVDTVRRAAASTATVLLCGASGSGKENLARLVHEASPRREGPFQVVNCAAIPDTLIESELFGHEKGAFTQATERRIGAFERADGGTIFLDEIGELSAAAQPKLLRILETGEVERLGGGRRRIDVRVVAATHRDLPALIRESKFREDLYFRLRVIEVFIPPLCERPEDILPLAEHFRNRYVRIDGAHVTGMSARAARALTHYKWPGNVREMRNVLERAIVLDRDGEIDLDDLPPEVQGALDHPAGGGPGVLLELLSLPWNECLERLRPIYLQNLLDLCEGDKTAVAEKAGVSKRQIYNWLSRLGDDMDEPAS